MGRKPYLRIRFFIAAVVVATLFAQGIPAGSQQRWTASWITHPTAPLREPLVLHFRKSLELAAKPDHYIVHVSADNRFVLYVMGIARAMDRREAIWRIGAMRLSIFLSI